MCSISLVPGNGCGSEKKDFPAGVAGVESRHFHPALLL